MFEIIQRDGQPLRFGDDYRWEYFCEESASSPDGIKEDRQIVRVFKSFVDADEELITTIFRPLRVDSVDEDTALNPYFRIRIGTKCVRCGHTEN